MLAPDTAGYGSYWRSIAELHGEEVGLQGAGDEFAPGSSEWPADASRRQFLKLVGASLALAGLTGACARQPEEKILPYVRPPEQVVPGRPLYFATAMPFDGYGRGVLVESHEGRPTKIEGNPDHPASLGGTDVFMQASILTLYDPDRSQVVNRIGAVSSWGNFLGAVEQELARRRSSAASGIRILTETITSPTLAEQIKGFLAEHPGARWHQYQPVNRDASRAGAMLALGQDLAVVHQFANARVVLSLDADFLSGLPGSVRYARDFISRRQVRNGQLEMSRLWVVESSSTITGSMADQRLPMRPGRIAEFAWMVYRAVGGDGGPRPEEPGLAAWLSALVADLRRHPGEALVVVGESMPPEVHALGHAINHLLGAVGKTLTYTPALEAEPVDQGQSLRELVADMDAGAVDVLVILGGNPVYTAPADLEFGRKLEALSRRKVRRPDGSEAPAFTVHLSLYEDETSRVCRWHVPESHYLEAWGDVRGHDGTASIIQPLIAPLYATRSALELVSALRGQASRTGYEMVRQHWTAAGLNHASWEAALEKGVVAGSAFTAVSPPAPKLPQHAARPAATSLEIVFRPDPAVWDGSFANNGWLQELPKPLTKLVWDNAALLGPGLARRLGVGNGQMLRLGLEGRNVEAPAWVQPGHPDDAVTLHLGYGRRFGGRIVKRGVDAYALRTSKAPWSVEGLKIERLDRTYPLASTQVHHVMDMSAVPASLRPQPIARAGEHDPASVRALTNRKLIREATVRQLAANPRVIQEMDGEARKHELSLYPEVWKYDKGHRWGMSIDLTSCIGCSACVIACQAENNIPIVGKEQVLVGREMHWLRIDDYYGGDVANPAVHHQPVPCMHCENAPCEVVCPVGATTHSAEGLNEMTYNRCVGTRYCSNNCPYKVRRFNFLQYVDPAPSLKLGRNPDVTVRDRGIMEKCTYCVQRINRARIEIQKVIVGFEEQARQASSEPERQEYLRRRDQLAAELLHGLQTACQQACPTRAIVFGDMNSPAAEVTRLKGSPLDYGLLTELTTRPRTTYLARITNPSEELAPKA